MSSMQDKDCIVDEKLTKKNMIFFINGLASDWWLTFSKLYFKICSKPKK